MCAVVQKVDVKDETFVASFLPFKASLPHRIAVGTDILCGGCSAGQDAREAGAPRATVVAGQPTRDTCTGHARDTHANLHLHTRDTQTMHTEKNMNEIPTSPVDDSELNHNTTPKRRKVLSIHNGTEQESATDLHKNMELLKTQQLINFDTLDLRQASFNLLRTNLELLKTSQKDTIDLRQNINLRLQISEVNDESNCDPTEEDVEMSLDREDFKSSDIDNSRTSDIDKDSVNNNEDVPFTIMDAQDREEDDDVSIDDDM